MPAQPLTDEQAQALEAKYLDPSTGSIMRRAIGRLLAGIVAVGPQSASLPVAEPTKADLKAKAARDADVAKRQRATVTAELKALDRHREDVARRIEAMDGAPGSRPTFLIQELRAEHRQLAELRQMLEADLAAGPITVDRDGRPIDDKTRRYVAFRAGEIREGRWAAAERFSRSGDHREARVARRDALRARMLAEYELGHRQSLPGYGMAAWT